MKTFTKLLFLISMLFGHWAAHPSVHACNLSSFVLNSIVQNGGNWDITATLCVGAGVTGFVQGADQGTELIAAFFYGPPGSPVSVLSAGPAAITSTFLGCTMTTSLNGGPIDSCISPDPCGPPYYNTIDDAVFLSPNACNLGFTCVLSTPVCGNVHQDCFILTYTTDIMPDSIRMLGVEGASQAFGGCYPNIDMLIDLTTTPVTFGDFTVKPKLGANVLDWFTTAETNNAGFEILRSADGSAYHVIGNVDSKANGTGKQSYQFIDVQPLSDQSYYKVRQIDHDGQMADSKVVEVSSLAPSTLEWAAVGPNPSSGIVNLSFISEAARALTLTLSNMEGKVLRLDHVNAYTGLNTVAVDLAGLGNGAYFLRLSNGDATLTQKLMKF